MPYLFLLFIYASILSSSYVQAVKRAPHSRTIPTVGKFNIHIPDPVLRFRTRNATEFETAVDCLYDRDKKWVVDHEADLPTDKEEEEELEHLVQECHLSQRPIGIWKLHNDTVAKARAEYSNRIQGHTGGKKGLWLDEKLDLAEIYLSFLEQTQKILAYGTLESFMGVGIHVECQDAISQSMTNASEWDKIGQGAATTVMALLPTILAFGNLYVPRSSEAFATSWLVGLGAALFTFGLPVRSRNAVPSSRLVKLGTYGIKPLSLIADLGKRTTKHTELSTFYEWTTNPKDKAYMTDFSTIREKALYKWQERLHYWQVPAVIIAALQAVIFAFALEPLFRSYGVPRFIFACANHNWTALYLLSSAVISSVFRFFMWQLSEHELVSVYALSNRAKASLRRLIHDVPQHERRSTLTELPPLYPPLISTIRSIPQRITGNVQHDHPRDAHWQPIKDYVRYFAAIFHTPVGTMKSGFINTKASPRWRPLVILLHLSTVGRPQIKTLFTGFIEAVLLLILTFFFASQWGGNLYITMLALTMLLIFVTLGRALALVYVWFSARIWGLHVINCDEEEEIRGCMRILCSMEDALVIVNGAHYYNGYRLDFIGGAFRRWKNEYSRGMYDEDFSREEETASSPNTERSGLRKDEILNDSELV